MKKTYITVEIYRGSYNCDLNHYNKDNTVFLPVTGGHIKPEHLEGYAQHSGIAAIPVIIVKRNLPGGEYIHAEPDKPGSWAFGGTFISCSDSRMHEINKYPIPLHDRNMQLEK